MKKKSNEIIKKLSLKHYIPVVEVEAVINSQFSFVRKVIESGEKDKEDTFKTVKLLNFGKFVVHDKVIYKLKKAKEKNANTSKQGLQDG